MKCIDDELIQRFIDSETDSQETARIEKHLADCAQCVRNVEGQRAFAGVIKSNIESWGSQPVIIPGFVTPVSRKNKLNLKIRHYIYAVSAVAAVLLIVVLRPEQNKEELNTVVQLIYSFDGDFDSNKTVSQQEMTFFMITPDGKVVEFK